MTTSSDLMTLLVPFKMMLNKNALSPLYSTIELGPEGIYGCSAYAYLEVAGDLGINETCFVNAAMFITVVESLPERGEMTLIVKDGALHWTCKRARGKLALVILDSEMPKIGKQSRKGAWEIDRLFSRALQLGSISCDNNSLSSVGMYGIVVDNREALTVYSSDNITISACQVGEFVVDQMPNIFTLPPEAAAVLATAAKQGGHIVFSENNLYFYNAAMRMLIRYAPGLSHDIAKVVAKQLTSEKHFTQMPRERIAAFIRRVGVMAESQRHATVSMLVKEGQIALAFDEGVSASDEYFVGKDLKNVPDMEVVHLNATKVARALDHTTVMILDNMDQRVLILRGEGPLFYYIICGSATTKSLKGARAA